MFSHYGKLSTEVYDLDKPVGRSFGEIEFYQERLKGLKGLILEPGVGSGRVLIPFLQAGFKIEGFDNSPEMISSCHARLKVAGLESNIWNASMTDFESQNKYDAVIIPTCSILLLNNRKDLIAALKLFYKYLKPNGRILLDVFLQTEFETNKLLTRTWVTPEAQVITMESKLVECNFLEQKTVTHLKYEKWKNGKLIDTELQDFSLLWFGIDELTMILKSTGFEDIQIFGDYSTSTPLSSDTGVFTFEARKSKEE